MKTFFSKFPFLVLLSLVFAIQSSATLEQESEHQHYHANQVIQNLKTLPLYFIENKGQLDASVMYHVKIPNTNAYLTPGEIVYQFTHSEETRGTNQDKLNRKDMKTNRNVKVENIRMSFIGARDKVMIEGLREREAKVSFLKGKDSQKWIKRARTYERVLYKELYPHIDLMVFGNDGKIKHEYRVRVGGEPEKIALKYEGIEQLRINKKGQLEIETTGGILVEDKPFCYQIIDGKKVEVESSYRLDENEAVKFEVGYYRKEMELLIDPALVYSSFLGGGEFDYGYGIATDRYGNAYVTGIAGWQDFPTTPGAFDTTWVNSEAFVSKFNPTGTNLVYSTYLGGSNSERGNAVVVDEYGNAFVTGYTDSTDFPISPMAYDTSFNGNLDIFIAKLNATGTDVYYSTYLGGNDADQGNGIAIDGNGNAYITGDTHSVDLPLLVGSYDTSHNGNKDAFVTKLNSSGTSLLYLTYLGGNNSDAGNGIAIDVDEAVYITGTTYSNNFPVTVGAYDTGYNSNGDVTVTKLNSSGTALDYSTYLGGNQSDHGLGIAVDGNKDVYITGWTTSGNFPTTLGSFDTSYNADGDVFITKLNTAGSNLHYSTFIGGSIGAFSAGDSGRGIAVDKGGNAYVTGHTMSSDFPTTVDAFDTSLSPDDDVILIKLDASGTFLHYSTYIGGDTVWGEGAYAIAVDDSGGAYITGDTYSAGYPTTPGAYDTSHNGFWDVFVTKIMPTTRLPVVDGHDFDGDNLSDIAVWRPLEGRWYFKDAGSYVWGQIGDVPVNGDYNGDGTTDIGVWRPSNGRWYLKDLGEIVWGTAGDIPVPGDYNGDGTTDIAVWRPSNGLWYVLGQGVYNWGTSGDVPVPADYNGDNTSDIAVWRPSDGVWYILNIDTYAWGTWGDVPVPGDYDGNGTTEIALWRLSDGFWYIYGNGTYQWGQSGDIPLVR